MADFVGYAYTLALSIGANVRLHKSMSLEIGLTKFAELLDSPFVYKNVKKRRTLGQLAFVELIHLFVNKLMQLVEHVGWVKLYFDFAGSHARNLLALDPENLQLLTVVLKNAVNLTHHRVYVLSPAVA